MILDIKVKKSKTGLYSYSDDFPVKLIHENTHKTLEYFHNEISLMNNIPVDEVIDNVGDEIIEEYEKNMQKCLMSYLYSRLGGTLNGAVNEYKFKKQRGFVEYSSPDNLVFTCFNFGGSEIVDYRKNRVSVFLNHNENGIILHEKFWHENSLNGEKVTKKWHENYFNRLNFFKEIEKRLLDLKSVEVNFKRNKYIVNFYDEVKSYKNKYKIAEIDEYEFFKKKEEKRKEFQMMSDDIKFFVDVVKKEVEEKNKNYFINPIFNGNCVFFGLGLYNMNEFKNALEMQTEYDNLTRHYFNSVRVFHKIHNFTHGPDSKWLRERNDNIKYNDGKLVKEIIENISNTSPSKLETKINYNLEKYLEKVDLLKPKLNGDIEEVFNRFYSDLTIQDGFYYDKVYLKKNVPVLGFKSKSTYKNGKSKTTNSLGYRCSDQEVIMGEKINGNSKLFEILLSQWFSKKYELDIHRVYLGDGHRLVTKKQHEKEYPPAKREEFVKELEY